MSNQDRPTEKLITVISVNNDIITLKTPITKKEFLVAMELFFKKTGLPAIPENIKYAVNMLGL